MKHTFDITLAQTYGIDQALLIHHFQYWISHNKRNNQNLKEGKTWTFQTIEDIHKHFPYWNTYHIRYCLKKLIDKKILIKANFNKKNFDKTNWYAFGDESSFLKSPSPLVKSHSSKTLRCGKIHQPIPHNKQYTDNTIDISKDISLSSPPLNSAEDPMFEPVKKKKKEASAEAKELSTLLYTRLKSLNPGFKQPNLENWAWEMEKVLKLDFRPKESVLKLIDYVFEDDPFWFKIIQSPQSLRKHYDKIWFKVANIQNKASMKQINLDVARQIHSAQGNYPTIKIFHNYIVHSETGDSISTSLSPETFEEILCNWTNMKRNIRRSA